MKRNNLIYIVTSAFAAFVVLASGYYLVKSMYPSADVLTDYDYNNPVIKIADFDPGDAKVIHLNEIPIIAWRRNSEDIRLAKQQDDPDLWISQYSYISEQSNPDFAHDADLTLNQEWFFALARSPDGFGCVVRVREGEYEGFFDPCRSVHFDLAGRVRKGASAANLVVVSADFTEDGQHIKLDLTRLVLRR